MGARYFERSEEEAVACDEDLADRIRELVAGEPATEKKMFGGLAFLIGLGPSALGGIPTR